MDWTAHGGNEMTDRQAPIGDGSKDPGKPSRRKMVMSGLGVAVTIAGVARPLTADAAVPASDPSIANTGSGRVRGARSGGALVFKGGPYGRSPRETRFQPPQPPAPW